jgi:DNA-binding HxlR family transcriptional regulator
LEEKNTSLPEPIQYTIEKIGGNWKMRILWFLRQNPKRFGELKKGIPPIADKMLSAQLKSLLADEYISREAFGEVPPRVEYAITEKGKKFIPLIKQIEQFGQKLLKEDGLIEPEKKKTAKKKVVDESQTSLF